MTEDGDADDIEPVEVEVEPLNRGSAARRAAGRVFGQVDVMRDMHDARDARREPGAPASVFRLEQLPPRIADEPAEKLARANRFLANDELDAAITLAHEVLWEYPSLAAAKIVIARAFILRNARAKARSVLQTIPESEKTDEARALTRSAQSGREEIRRDGTGKRSADATGASAPASPDSPAPRTPLHIHMWILFAALLAGLFLLWLHIMAAAAPERYAVMRSRLPAGWEFLPRAETEETGAGEFKPAD